MEDLCWSMFWFALLCNLSSFAIILMRKRESWLLCFNCLSGVLIVTVNTLWRFLVVPWIDLQCVILLFPDHTHLLRFVKLTTTKKKTTNS